MNVVLKFRKLRPEAIIPEYQTAGAAGMDICACDEDGVTTVIQPGGRAIIKTGLSVEITKHYLRELDVKARYNAEVYGVGPSEQHENKLDFHYELQVRSRSGLAFKEGIFVLNSPGTIDEDYRGEICVILANFGNKDFHISRGMRIAQLVVNQIVRPYAITTSTVLSDTERGSGGFGSTGLSA